MVYEAETLRDQLFNNWTLSDPVARLGAETLGDEPIIHLAHPQIKGQQRSKTVQVRKLTPLANIIRHPKFDEVSDTFEITVTYNLAGVGSQLWDLIETGIEDVEEEIIRILRTIHNPFNGTGGFFRTQESWQYFDDLFSRTPVMKRILRFTISKLQSDSQAVFEGFGGVLTFDAGQTTNADNPPGGNVVYSEAYNVVISEGHRVIEHLTNETVNGARVPALVSGRFQGTFSAQIYASADDIGSTAEKLNQIYLLQANDEHINVVFLHAVQNTENTPQTLTQTSFVKITGMEKVTSDEQLVHFNVTGRLRRPSTYAVS